MTFWKYIKDNWLEILIYIVLWLFTFLLLSAFKVQWELILSITILHFTSGMVLLLYSFFRRRQFYQNFLVTLESLDKKYLIGDMIKEPNFLEGKILTDSIYEIGKAMGENINDYKFQLTDFKEYMELWVHEIKVPISSCILINHNYSTPSSKKMLNELTRIEDYVEQILYYARSENIEKDYFVRKCSLKSIVQNVMKKNKNRLLYKKISLDIELENESIRTDSKWLEFILHQILNNSIQYAKIQNAKIHIWSEKQKNAVKVHIWDNGIGISQEDLKRVFDKGFTGHNGRVLANATGMGLYLTNKMIQKMGHAIEISSTLNVYTEVTITFFETDFYKVLK